MFKELVPISNINVMFSSLWPLSWSIISTTCLVTLALCLSPFSSSGSRNVLPIRSLGSKVGIGLDPDEFSSSLDLMKTVGASVPVGNLLGIPVVIQRKFYLQKVSEDAETSPPCGASLWLGVEDFVGLTSLL